jgi:phosphoribosylformylglycinamidine synthase subunit PurSL
MGSRLVVTDTSALLAGRRYAEQAHLLLGAGVESVEAIVRSQMFMVDRNLTLSEQRILESAVLDPQTQSGSWDSPATNHTIDVALRPGVTDPVGVAFETAAEIAGVSELHVRSGFRFEVLSRRSGAELDGGLLCRLAHEMLHNPIVEEVSIGQHVPARFDQVSDNSLVEVVPLRDASNDDLARLNQERGLALDPGELIAVQQFFVQLDRDPTDAELETIAQTWSEHCSHKTFRAAITWNDGTQVEPLLKQLRQSTDTIAAPWVKSAFVDNAGIISFDERFDVAIKVETHNHPSAVEPFGGANTGVGGVIRDVLGVAADPIAATDILCFGSPDTPIDALPAGVLHPLRIRTGVIAGVADYGNKLGLPTVAGAIVHHDGFIANPLVFCGCVGLRPVDLQLSGQRAGDLIVVIGGATGRDGIRGATFSSATMDATTGDVAGASVQIGDPIIEKLVGDVLREARDHRSGPLFSAITDCGAGGFSSAVGEIAADLGADVELDLAPRKYAGLAPWEVWLSEAQERMILAVPPESAPALQAICDAHGVSMAALGTFRNDGQLVVRATGKLIVDLPGAFLHNGRPTRHLTARRATPPAATSVREAEAILSSAGSLLCAVLSHADVRSNQDVVRGYDHEILGATIGRPYLGARDDGPADAAVLAPLVAVGQRGLSISLGLNCRTGVFDARRMAEAVVDEAVRNAVCVGADPDQMSLLDNFSWGDPRRPETLGQLVDAVAGCVTGAAAFGAPFVSGKDSLNNEYLDADGVRTAIPPTLVITALGVVPEAEAMITSDLKTPGDVLVLVGGEGRDLRGSVLDAVLGIEGGGRVPGGDPESPQRYRAVHALMRSGKVRGAHDVSDGGLVTCLAEMAIGGRLGIEVDLGATGDPVAALFGESSGRLVLEVAPADVATVCASTGGSVIGVVAGSESGELLFTVRFEGRETIEMPVRELVSAWRGHVIDTAGTAGTADPEGMR